MQLVEYVGQKLKSDSVIEILEQFDMRVIYEFDRLHENTPDSYSSSAREHGFELRFNEAQILDTIWCYIQPRSGFSSVDKGIVGAPILKSFLDARSYAHASGVTASASKDEKSWFRLEYANVWIHYEFLASRLGLITFMLK
jgi:hypothetical protein